MGLPEACAHVRVVFAEGMNVERNMHITEICCHLTHLFAATQNPKASFLITRLLLCSLMEGLLLRTSA